MSKIRPNQIKTVWLFIFILAILLPSILIPYLGYQKIRGLAPPEQAAAPREVGPIDMTLDLEPLPLRDREGVVEKHFKSSDWKSDPWGALMKISEELGLNEITQELTESVQKEFSSSTPQELLSNWGKSDQWYPLTKQIFLRVPDQDLVEKKNQYNELAAAMIIVAGSTRNRSSERTVSEYAGGAASVILHRLSRVTNECWPSLNLALTNSLGVRPRRDQQIELEDKALDRCSRNASSRFLAATTALNIISRGTIEDIEESEIEKRQLRETTRLERVTDKESALDLTLTGFAELFRAENSRVSQPFVARNHARRSLQLLRKAIRLREHPGIVAAEARSERVLGNHEQALTLLERTEELNPKEPSYQLLHNEILEQSGQFEAAASRAEKQFFEKQSGSSILPGNYRAFGAWSDQILNSFTYAEATWILDPTFTEGSGGEISDTSMLPKWRSNEWLIQEPGKYSPHTYCPIPAQIRRLITLGRTSDADTYLGNIADGWEDQYTHFCSGNRGNLKNWIDAFHSITSGTPTSIGHDHSIEDHYDELQNLYRFANRLDAAESLIRLWLSTSSDQVTIRARLGEVLFWKGEYAKAATEFQFVAGEFEAKSPTAINSRLLAHGDSIELLIQKFRTRQALSLERSGDSSQAKKVFDSAINIVPAEGMDSDTFFLKGSLDLRLGDYPAAVTSLRKAIELIQYRAREDKAYQHGADGRLGATANNLSLALTLSGNSRPAQEAASLALQVDPLNPIYLETAALAQEASGDLSAAINKYRTALKEEPSLYTAGNNLAITLARKGHLDEAKSILQEVLLAQPGYARGWANLAMAHSNDPGFDSFLLMNGAQSRAASIDPAYQGKDPRWWPDKEIYQTGIDVAQPIHPNWSFSASAQLSKAPFSWFLVLVALSNIMIAIIWFKAQSKLVETTLEEKPRSWTLWQKVYSLSFPWILAIFVGLPVVWFTFSLTPMSVDSGNLLLAWTFLFLSLTIFQVRRVVSAAAPQRAWATLLLLCLAATPFKLGILPAATMARTASGSEEIAEFRRCSSHLLLTLGTLTCVLGLIAWSSGMPFSRSVFLMCLGTFGILSTPLKPLDGHYLSPRMRGVLGTVLLLFSVAVGMNWI